MSRFVVDLGPLKLSDAQKNAIASAIQQAVLAHLAPLSHTQGDATADTAASGNYIMFPREWYGYILRRSFGELEQGEKQIAPFANQRM